MMRMMQILCVMPALVVAWHVIHATATLDGRRFSENWRFAALTGHYALAAAGSLAVAASAPVGGPLLLISLALRYLADRRRT